jgi:uncharacterized protein (TIGR00251 family)
MEWPIKRVPGGVTFAVRVTPRSHKNEILGTQGQALRVKLNAPPVEGAANEALCDFLASRLGVRKSAVTIVAGHTSHNKIVRVESVTADQARALLPSSYEAGDA